MRRQIRAELLAVRPLDQRERTDRAAALAWVDSGEPLCRTAKPATPPRHLVSYFVLVAESRILLVDHRNAGLWLPTGGHVEPGEHPRVTVLRELEEELGVVFSAEVGAPLMVTESTTVGRTAGHVDVSLWYVLPVSRRTALRPDPVEFREIRWFRPEEIPLERSDPHMGRFLRKLAEQADQ